MHDVVIRGGRVVDGTGAPARIADVAIEGDRIAAVGEGLGAGRREIDADGLLVTPGFVDIHTHYDGQATWDPMMTPSSWHGVTTTVFGNCGVGFAPVRPGAERYLINLMEGVEDIPETVLAEGVSFNWESFPDYLDELDRTPRVMDIGAQTPHGPLRFYVMGERGADHQADPTEREIAQMADLLEASLRAGALGFSTSRTTKHRVKDGRFVPSLTAHEPELFGLAEAMRRAGRGVLEVNSDFGPGEFEVLRRAAEIAGRPLSCLLLQTRNEPELWRETLQQIREARADGLEVVGQVGARSVGMLIGLETSVNPFLSHPAWRPLEGLTPRQRYERLRDDAELRRRLVEESFDTPSFPFGKILETTFPMGERPELEPPPERSLGARARQEGRSVWSLALDAMLADEGRALLMHPFENYSHGDFEALHEMLTDDATVMGLGDGGAHVSIICDASGPTALLSHWARDRSRGPRIPLEALVRKQTRDGAGLYDLHDRGVLAPGKKADVNVIEFERLSLLRPQIAYDLPAGGRRIVQRAQGYRRTFVSGVETLVDDELTGETPGRLLR